MSASGSDRPAHFSDFFPAAWLQTPEYHEIRLEFVPSAVVFDPELGPIAQAALDFAAKIVDHPVTIGAVRIEKSYHLPVPPTMIRTYEDGKEKFAMYMEDAQLFPGDYFMIASPITGNSKTWSEEKAKQATQSARTFLTMAFGHTAADKTRFAVRMAKDGTFGTLGGPTRLFPKVRDSLFAEPADWTALMSNAARPDEADLSRIQAALGFVDSAINEDRAEIKFALLWLALESASGGFIDRTLKRLGHLGDESKTLEQLRRKRNRFFHKGEMPDISAQDERVLFYAIFSESFRKLKVPQDRIRELCELIDSDPVESIKTAYIDKVITNFRGMTEPSDPDTLGSAEN